ncbi:MAG: DUF1330 domain-containing protein [Alphaproteobacteria bacterium]|nr:DUF1330 domain-containing protein [Alphaproteobacteria bacterium]
MSKGYVLAKVTVRDATAYEDYRSKVLATIEAHGGRFLVRGGAAEVKEGGWTNPRLVVIEFPSVEAARGWYASPAYRAILPGRTRNADSDVVIVAGV